MQLIRSNDDRVIWSKDYEEPSGVAGINAAQSAAVVDIARALKAHVNAPLVSAIERGLTQDSTALRLYRLGRHFYDRGGIPDMYRSVDYYKQAIEKDSSFALAYVGLADAAGFVGERELRPSVEWMPQVERYLRKALALDETIPEAHSLLATYYSDYVYDSVSAEQEHKRAVELNPNSVQVRLWYGLHLLILEKLEPALAQYRKAVELDPMMPLARGQFSRALIFAGKHNLALAQLRSGMETYPAWPMFMHLLAMSLVLRGNHDSAVAVLNRADKTPWNGWLYGVAGRPDTTQRILDSLTAQSATRPVDPIGVAVLQIGLGHKSDALTSLERAYAERSVSLRFFIGPHPAFKALRTEPRFQALRRRAGFTR
jgi:tetratricopeptide (TPR) repeat protein